MNFETWQRCLKNDKFGKIGRDKTDDKDKKM